MHHFVSPAPVNSVGVISQPNLLCFTSLPPKLQPVENQLPVSCSLIAAPLRLERWFKTNVLVGRCSKPHTPKTVIAVKRRRNALHRNSKITSHETNFPDYYELHCIVLYFKIQKFEAVILNYEYFCKALYSSVACWEISVFVKDTTYNICDIKRCWLPETLKEKNQKEVTH